MELEIKQLLSPYDWIPTESISCI